MPFPKGIQNNIFKGIMAINNIEKHLWSTRE